MKRLTILTMTIALAMATAADAAVNKAVFASPLVYRSDGAGSRTFSDAVLSGAELADDGSIVSGNSGGTVELAVPYQSEGLIYAITATYTFTGEVTMEVSATGNSKDYVAVVNGVPLEYVNLAAGSNLKWKAALGPNSSLTEVRLTYSDLSGVIGDFGSPLLSGFSARRKIYIKGSAAGELYNYQMRVKVGESKKSAGCDLTLNGAMKSDFNDIRFTLTDGETVLPHYLEEISGIAPDRAAAFWVKIPQIPKDGLSIYVYYGKENAGSLSDAGKVFDFYEDFDGAALDAKKWKIVPDIKTGAASIEGSTLSLDLAKIYTTDYKFDYGIIEYKAKLSGLGAIAAIIRAGSSGNDDLVAYSSILPAAAHCVAKGVAVKANTAKPIALNTYYNYMIIRGAGGDVTFSRYGMDPASAAEAEVKYTSGIQTASAIGLSPGNLGMGMSCEFIRTRKYADPPAQVDIIRTSSGNAEAVRLPEFSGIVTAVNGDLVLAEEAAGGYYISKLISSPFKARIIKPSWTSSLQGSAEGAISVSTKDGGKFYSGWENGAARYVSKKEFEAGDKLRFKVSFNEEGKIGIDRDKEGISRLKSFALEFYPGAIRVAMPNSKETVIPGSKYNILWETSGYEAKYPMEISYSIAGAEPFTAIASKVSNSGNYAWDVPAGDFSSVVVKVADSFDASIYGVSEGRGAGAIPKDEEGSIGINKDKEGNIGIDKDKKAEKTEEKEAGHQSKTQLYEMAIMLRDNVLSDPEEDKGSYKKGDIVMIVPAGHNWSETERNSFLIVKAYLTQEKVNELMRPKEIDKGVDARGNKIVERAGRGNFRIDLKKQKNVSLLKTEAIGEK